MEKTTPVDEVIKLTGLGMDDSKIIKNLTDRGYSPVQISDALNQAKIKQEIRPAGMPPQSPSPQGLMPSMSPLPPKMQQPQGLMPQPLGLQQTPAQPQPSQLLQTQEIPIPKPSAVPPTPMPPVQSPNMGRPYSREEPTYPYAYPTYEEESIGAPKMETEAIEELAEEIVNEKWQEVKSKIGDVIEWKSYAERRINSIDERIKRMESSMDRLQAALLSKVNEYGRGVKDLGAEMNSLEGALGKILSPLVDNIKELGKITEDLKKSEPATKKKKKKFK